VNYAEEGNDTADHNAWTAYHAKKCIDSFVDSRECMVAKKTAMISGMKEKLTPEQWEEFQKKMRYAAHKNIGLDNFEETWRPDMDYTGYFKSFRAHMKEQIKLDEELQEAKDKGKIPEELWKFQPKKFAYKGE
jgi:hypothetical protein